jgi:hypothetical protein
MCRAVNAVVSHSDSADAYAGSDNPQPRRDGGAVPLFFGQLGTLGSTSGRQSEAENYSQLTPRLRVVFPIGPHKKAEVTSLSLPVPMPQGAGIWERYCVHSTCI